MSHTRFLFHIVFATKARSPIIDPRWESELYKYITGIVRNLNGRVIEINGMPDHIHILVSLQPCDFRDFMRELKASSSRWAKRHHPKFSWQRRYGAFTVSESAVDGVRDYIRRQKEHHKERTFEQEYVSLLRKHSVEFDERYIWDCSDFGAAHELRVFHTLGSYCMMVYRLRFAPPVATDIACAPHTYDDVFRDSYTFRLRLHV